MSEERVVNLDNLKMEDLDRGERYRKKADRLSTRMGARKLGYHVEEIPPKSFSYPYHFHHAQEELFLVLAGRAVLRLNDEYREVGEGDLILCPTGPEGVHQFYNPGPDPFRMLALSNQDPMEVCEYPDSDKMLVFAGRKIFRRSEVKDYLDGEEDPSAHWPEERL